MALILKGGAVASNICAGLQPRVKALAANNVIPTLAVVRLGERADDIAYERGLLKRCGGVGVAVKCFALDENVAENELISVLRRLSNDKQVHGILVCRPLAERISDEAVRSAIASEKDVDGITDLSLAGVFIEAKLGYPPCTAEACVKILEHYGFEIQGKHIVVIGRSLVVGRSVAMLLLSKNATVTICHTETAELAAICRRAHIIVTATGCAGLVDETFMSPGQIIVDVGINVLKDGSICGDADTAVAEKVAAAVTPVPGGVGAVTTAVLAEHVVSAAERQCKS